MSYYGVFAEDKAVEELLFKWKKTITVGTRLNVSGLKLHKMILG